MKMAMKSNWPDMKSFEFSEGIDSFGQLRGAGFEKPENCLSPINLEQPCT